MAQATGARIDTSRLSVPSLDFKTADGLDVPDLSIKNIGSRPTSYRMSILYSDLQRLIDVYAHVASHLNRSELLQYRLFLYDKKMMRSEFNSPHPFFHIILREARRKRYTNVKRVKYVYLKALYGCHTGLDEYREACIGRGMSLDFDVFPPQHKRFEDAPVFASRSVVPQSDVPDDIPTSSPSGMATLQSSVASVRKAPLLVTQKQNCGQPISSARADKRAIDSSAESSASSCCTEPIITHVHKRLFTENEKTIDTAEITPLALKVPPSLLDDLEEFRKATTPRLKAAMRKDVSESIVAFIQDAHRVQISPADDRLSTLFESWEERQDILTIQNWVDQFATPTDVVRGRLAKLDELLEAKWRELEMQNAQIGATVLGLSDFVEQIRAQFDEHAVKCKNLKGELEDFKRHLKELFQARSGDGTQTSR